MFSEACNSLHSFVVTIHTWSIPLLEMMHTYTHLKSVGSERQEKYIMNIAVGEKSLQLYHIYKHT